MSKVRTTTPRALRVILCLKFAQSAPFNEVAELKRALISSEWILHSIDATGSFDFMAEAEHESLAEYQAMLDDFAGRFGHLVEHYEASFVCRRYLREADDSSGHIWIPTASGMQRLDHDRIERICSEGDYVRIHCGETSWLVHDTMKNVARTLDQDQFLRLNRSLIVRADLIERLTHRYRRWIVRMFDGSEHPIAKSRSALVIAKLRATSSNCDAASPASESPAEKSVRIMENMLQ